MQSTCSLRAVYVLYTCSLRAAYVQSTCSLRVAYVQRMCCLRAVYVQPALADKNFSKEVELRLLPTTQPVREMALVLVLPWNWN